MNLNRNLRMDDKLIEQLTTLDPTEAADALKQHAQPLFQLIFNQGHSAATAANKSKLDALNGQLEELTSGRTTLESELEELRKKQPDLEKWKEEKEAALLRQAEAHKAETERLRQAIRDRVTGNERLQLVNALVNKGVDKWMAEKVVGQDELRRLGVQLGEDGSPSVRYYQPDGETPLALSDGVKPHDVIAQDIIGSMPEALRPRNGQRGSNLASAGTGGRTAISRSQFDGMSPEAKMGFIREGGQVVDG